MTQLNFVLDNHRFGESCCLHPYYNLKIEAAELSEVWVPVYKTTRRDTLEDGHLKIHRRVNPQSQYNYCVHTVM
jgi:hypothetical protein